MIDIQAVNESEGARVTRTVPKTGGYVEQWQRELEKAYQQSVDTMRSTGRRQVRARGPHQVMGPAADVRNGAATGTVPHTVSPSVATAATPASAPRMSPTVSPAAGAPLAQNAGSANLTAGAARPHTVPTAAPAVPTDRLGPLQHVVRNLLPDPTSVRLLNVDGGLHLVVRDAALEPHTLLRLVSRIKTGLGAPGRLLSTITLNGGRIWQSGDNPYPTAAGAERSAVDRHY